MTAIIDRDSLVRQGHEFSAPPQNTEAEEGVLGGILLDTSALPRIKDKLTPDAFYLEAHRIIYRGCLVCLSRDGMVDLMTICTYLHDKKQLDKIGGQAKLAQLVETVVSTVNIDKYVELINEKYLRRQLIELGRDAHYCGHETLKRLDESFSYLKEKATELQSLVGGKDRNHSRYQQAVQEFERLEMNIEDSGFRFWEKNRLCKKYADVGIKSVKDLENLWFSHMSSQEDEGFKSIQEIFNTVPPQREWFLHGLLPAQSLVTIHGPGGCGKSTLVYDFIYSLVTGTPWGSDSFNEGFSTTAAQRKIMLIQTDETLGEMVTAFHRRGITEDMPILLKMKWSIDKIPQLLKKAQEWKPDVIIIDCLTSVSTYSLFSENDVEYARPVLRLRKLAEQMNCCIILIHHSNKAGGMRGTTAIQNSSSEVISLEPNPDDKNPDSTKRLLVFNKSRSRRPVSYELELIPDTGTWSCLGEHKKHEDAALTTTKNKIIKFLRSRPNIRFEVAEMQNDFGGSTGNIRTCCAELARDGLISKFSLGRG
ncbi:DnaB-like helicase N-terminal domain-containing protein, partial [Limnofasciculus baicalensis]